MLTLFSFYPFSWSFAHSSNASLGPRVGSFSLVVVLRGAGSYDKSSASRIVCWEEYDVCVDGFFFLPLGSTWGCFYVF